MKKVFYIFICVLGFIIFDNNVKAYEIFNYNGISYEEDFIYNGFSQIEGFNINKHSNIYCTIGSSKVMCYALDDDTNYSLNGSFINVLDNNEDCYYYNFTINKANQTKNQYLKLTCSYNNGNLTFYSDTKSNFNFDFLDEETNLTYNVLDFSSYMSDDTEEIEEPIITTASNLTNFMIEKSKNIYNVLIQNDKMFFCIVLIMSYIVVIFTFKLIRR